MKDKVYVIFEECGDTVEVAAFYKGYSIVATLNRRSGRGNPHIVYGTIVNVVLNETIGNTKTHNDVDICVAEVTSGSLAYQQKGE